MSPMVLHSPVAYEVVLLDGTVLRFEDVVWMDEEIVLVDANPESDPDAYLYQKRIPHPAALGTVTFVTRVEPAVGVGAWQSFDGTWKSFLRREFITSMRRIDGAS